MVSQFVIAVVGCFLVVAEGVIGPVMATSSSKDESYLQSFLRARCGPTGNAVWVYRGALYDPLDGKKIANVQGLELVRCLATTDSSLPQKERFRKRCRDLQAAESVGNPESIIDYAGTILSRKLFCYTNVEDDSGNGSLLQRIRLRPNSPQKDIPIDQAATVYDTATTFVQRGSMEEGAAGEWILHTEWPDGRAIWTTTRVSSTDDGDEDDAGNPETMTVSSKKRNKRRRFLEYTSYARPQPLWRQKLPDLTRPPVRQGLQKLVTSPERSAWIQVGSNDQPNEASKYGARETYHYDLDLDSRKSTKPCTLRYTRYGEGPIWYGPGRLCTLELTGKRVSNWSDGTLLQSRRAAQLALEKVVGFLSVNSPVAEDDELAGRAVDWFRGKGSALLQIAPELKRDQPSWLYSVQDTCATVVHRLRAATTMTIGAPPQSLSTTHPKRRKGKDSK